MLQVLHMKVDSFYPLDRTPMALRDQWEREIRFDTVSSHVQATREQILHQEEHCANTYAEVVWHALQCYFGQLSLPSRNVVEAYRDGNEQSYRAWDTWVETIDDRLVTLFVRHPAYPLLYIEIAREGHKDLLILDDDSVELFFRTAGKDKRNYPDAWKGLFQSLLAGLLQHGLSLINHHMELTYVDEGGLHTATLDSFVQALGNLYPLSEP